MDQNKESAKVIYRVSAFSLIGNVGLSIFKFIAGFLGNSAAMISDAVHSSSDVMGTFLVILGAYLSGKSPDKEHPYGHERFECIISILLSDILFFVGGILGYNGILKILNPSEIQVPTMLPVIAAIVSIVVKEGMYWYTIVNAKKINSVSLKAEAWHHRSDALSSIGSLVGIIGARMGYLILDPVASIIIGAMIIKVAVDIFRETMDKMIDKQCDEKIIDIMKEEVLSVKGVQHIDFMRTRQFGSRIYVDIEITMDGSITLCQAHDVAETVHHLLERNHPEIKHCMVHVNPDTEEHHDFV